MSLCNKQHLSNLEAQVIKKVSSTEAESKKCVAYKKACNSFGNMNS